MAQRAIEAVRRAILNAVPIRPIIEPAPTETTADASAPPPYARHLDAALLRGCPVQALGTNSGFGFFRDARGEYQAVPWSDLTRDGIALLFAGHEGWLRRIWPRGKSGWDPERAGETLAYCCCRAGLVSPRTFGFELQLPPLEDAEWVSDD